MEKPKTSKTNLVLPSGSDGILCRRGLFYLFQSPYIKFKAGGTNCRGPFLQPGREFGEVEGLLQSRASDPETVNLICIVLRV